MAEFVGEVFAAEIEHALANRVGDVAAEEDRAQEFEDGSDDNRVSQSQSAAPDTRPHRIGDIVRADVPSHVGRNQASDGENQHDGGFHSCLVTGVGYLVLEIFRLLWEIGDSLYCKAVVWEILTRSECY